MKGLDVCVLPVTAQTLMSGPLSLAMPAGLLVLHLGHLLNADGACEWQHAHFEDQSGAAAPPVQWRHPSPMSGSAGLVPRLGSNC